MCDELALLRRDRRSNVELQDVSGAETRVLAEGLNVDLDARGGVAGYDINSASRLFDLTVPEIPAPPFPADEMLA
jgi:hypothetical protein